MTPALQTRKPTFKVLEDEAFVSQCPITSRTASPERFAFSFPITDDDLLCEFDLYVSKVLSISVNNCGFDSLQSSASEGTKVTSVRATPPVQLRKGVNRVSGVVQYIYQKVVSRKFVGFRPSPKSAPEKILFWVKETLECGDSLAVYPVPGENFTARKRSCHECLLRLIKAVEKKPAQAYRETRKKMVGSGRYWSVASAIAAASSLAFVLYLEIPEPQIYSEPHIRVRVLQQYNPWNFRLQEVIDGVPQAPSSWHFCAKGNPPGFEIGMQLTRLAFIERTDCQELIPGEHAYHILRDPSDQPILPANCFSPGQDIPNVCDGEPQF